LVTYHH